MECLITTGLLALAKESASIAAGKASQICPETEQLLCSISELGCTHAPPKQAYKLLVDKFKVPLHLAGCLVKVSLAAAPPSLQKQQQQADTTAMLVYHLKEHLRCLQNLQAAASQPSERHSSSKQDTAASSETTEALLDAAVTQQLVSSGLLQRLPDLLLAAEQQLAARKCGSSDGTSSSNKSGCSSGRSRSSTPKPGTFACAATDLAQELVVLSTLLVTHWPENAITSADLGPCLLPALRLALTAVNTASKHVDAAVEAAAAQATATRSSTGPGKSQHKAGPPDSRWCQLAGEAVSLCLRVCAVTEYHVMLLGTLQDTYPRHDFNSFIHGLQRGRPWLLALVDSPYLLAAVVLVIMWIDFGAYSQQLVHSRCSRVQRSSSSSGNGRPRAGRGAADSIKDYAAQAWLLMTRGGSEPVSGSAQALPVAGKHHQQQQGAAPAVPLVQHTLLSQLHGCSSTLLLWATTTQAVATPPWTPECIAEQLDAKAGGLLAVAVMLGCESPAVNEQAKRSLQPSQAKYQQLRQARGVPRWQQPMLPGDSMQWMELNLLLVVMMIEQAQQAAGLEDWTSFAVALDIVGQAARRWRDATVAVASTAAIKQTRQTDAAAGSTAAHLAAIASGRHASADTAGQQDQEQSHRLEVAWPGEVTEHVLQIYAAMLSRWVQQLLSTPLNRYAPFRDGSSSSGTDGAGGTCNWAGSTGSNSSAATTQQPKAPADFVHVLLASLNCSRVLRQAKVAVNVSASGSLAPGPGVIEAQQLRQPAACLTAALEAYMRYLGQQMVKQEGGRQPPTLQQQQPPLPGASTRGASQVMGADALLEASHCCGQLPGLLVRLIAVGPAQQHACSPSNPAGKLHQQLFSLMVTACKVASACSNAGLDSTITRPLMNRTLNALECFRCVSMAQSLQPIAPKAPATATNAMQALLAFLSLTGRACSALACQFAGYLDMAAYIQGVEAKQLLQVPVMQPQDGFGASQGQGQDQRGGAVGTSQHESPPTANAAVLDEAVRIALEQVYVCLNNILTTAQQSVQQLTPPAHHGQQLRPQQSQQQPPSAAGNDTGTCLRTVSRCSTVGTTRCAAATATATDPSTKQHSGLGGLVSARCGGAGIDLPSLLQQLEGLGAAAGGALDVVVKATAWLQICQVSLAKPHNEGLDLVGSCLAAVNAPVDTAMVTTVAATCDEVLRGRASSLHGCPAVAALAAVQHSPACAHLLQQVEATGAALSVLHTKWACNNPYCSNLACNCEQQLMRGRSCVCGGCRAARYCSKACQVAHWKQHKSVCRALVQQAAAKMDAGSSQ